MLCNVLRQRSALESAASRLGALSAAVGGATVARPAEPFVAAAAAAALQHSRQYNPTTGWSHSWQDRNLSPPEASKTWKLLHNQGYDINPCRSPLHPSVTEAGIDPDGEDELSVQEAYTPESVCWGCGPSAPDGLQLRSFRIPGGLEATITLDSKYCAFPGIMNGGIISSIFDCHGNWTAAVALMDKGCLPKPPLTLTYEMLVTYKEPTPPDEPLIVRSQIVRIKESDAPGGKATVQVDMTLYQSLGGHEKLLCSATGLFKKLGALRAL